MRLAAVVMRSNVACWKCKAQNPQAPSRYDHRADQCSRELRGFGLEDDEVEEAVEMMDRERGKYEWKNGKACFHCGLPWDDCMHPFTTASIGCNMLKGCILGIIGLTARVAPETFGEVQGCPDPSADLIAFKRYAPRRSVSENRLTSFTSYAFEAEGQSNGWSNAHVMLEACCVRMYGPIGSPNM